MSTDTLPDSRAESQEVNFDIDAFEDWLAEEKRVHDPQPLSVHAEEPLPLSDCFPLDGDAAAGSSGLHPAAVPLRAIEDFDSKLDDILKMHTENTRMLKVMELWVIPPSVFYNSLIAEINEIRAKGGEYVSMCDELEKAEHLEVVVHKFPITKFQECLTDCLTKYHTMIKIVERVMEDPKNKSVKRTPSDPPSSPPLCKRGRTFYEPSSASASRATPICDVPADID